jgi:hypothetical protein
MPIKYAQDIYDFVEAIRMRKYELYELYNNIECKFRDETFNAFHDLLVRKHGGSSLVFIKSPTIDDD